MRRARGHRYGRRHKELRRRFARRMACGELIDPNRPWDLGHVGDNTAVGGERWPEHRTCNRATVTHLKQKLAEQADQAPVRSRRW
jgi:hypothetical protein